MSKANNPNMINGTNKGVERKTLGLTRRQQGGLLLAGITLSATLLGAGCSAKSVESQPQKTTTKVETEAKTEISQSEKAYAEYLKTLSPEQVALRESLNPDALAKMSESQLAEAFTIKADEVVVNGDIDIDLYAEAFSARYQAMANSGLSEFEYEKWGGLNSFGKDTMSKVSKEYYETQSIALYGYAAVNEINFVTLSVGSSVDTVIEGGTKPQPLERYHLRAVVKPELSDLSKQENGSYDARFSVHLSDNWDKEAMEMRALISEPMDQNLTFNVNGLYITDSGSVLPSSEITTN